ncbi:acyltransferase [Roseivivax sp. GX 12232]|uniref:acyltransferase family protein n=1 Tax=Roseivivax sp. GX 12232 TaxID=2900547 RepID=UPI001E2AAC43|nr:acyltransferase family protein [Roseivivax sp. GX 12232]MCE0503748.1 acyltransferase [Roseivivax sp. GX 12232]
MQYRKEIDGLRAVAVVPVILFHGGVELFSGGFVGVDVFFVISGFLITTLILGAKDKGTFSLLDFYHRRARRILPALLFVVLCSLPFAWALLLPGDMEDFAESLLGVALFVSNIIFKLQAGYFDTAAELKPLLHTWSLAVEEQFYILFPMLVLAIWRFGSRALTTIFGLIFVASLAYAHHTAYSDPETAFFFLAARAWELLLGSFAALYLRARPEPASGLGADLGAGLGLGLILFSVFAYDEETPFSSLYALAPTVGTLLVILCARPGTLVHRLLSLKLVVAVGLISYSLYLWHQPVFAFYRISGLSGGPWVFALLSAGILVASILTWRFVEQPFRRGVLGKGQVLLASAAALAGLAGIAVLTYANNDRLTALRFSEDFLGVIASAGESPKRDKCHFDHEDNAFPLEEACVYFGQEASWAVYGNSYGVELAYALAEGLEPRGAGLVHHTISGCPPSYRIDAAPHCEAFYQERLAAVLDDPEIRNVVLAFRTDGTGPEAARALVRLANDIAATGRTAHLVLHPPTIPRDIRFYISASRFSGGEALAARPLDTWAEQNAEIYNALSALDPEVNLVDLSEVFCDAQQCYALRDDKALYFDDHHISISGARLAAPHVLGQAE